MFSLRDLRFVLCSLDLDVLRAQRIMEFLSYITHKSTRSDHVVLSVFVSYLTDVQMWRWPVQKGNQSFQGAVLIFHGVFQGLGAAFRGQVYWLGRNLYLFPLWIIDNKVSKRNV